MRATDLNLGRLSGFSVHSEQAFSGDTDQTWETNGINTYERVTIREVNDGRKINGGSIQDAGCYRWCVASRYSRNRRVTSIAAQRTTPRLPLPDVAEVSDRGVPFQKLSSEVGTVETLSARTG